jgi:hypothetical protein
MLASPEKASPFCKNMDNTNAEPLAGAGAPIVRSKPKNASGAGARCGPTKMEVRIEEGEGK